MNFANIQAELVSKKEKKRVRDEYTSSLRKSFRLYAATLLAQHRLGIDIKDYEIHHIHPVSLGGSNKFSNLALVKPDLHDEIHWLIDRETRGMERGDKRLIKIPYFNGHIWGLE